MNSAEVREALRRRWPDVSYLHIDEAPLDPGRQGNKIDVLVVALWKTLRYEIEAVEIKVSVADFRNELNDYTWVIDWPADALPPDWLPRDRTYSHRQGAAYYAGRHGGTVRRITTPSTAKSEAWRAHAHRFWIAAPTAVAEKIRPLLPRGWGLLAVADDGWTSMLVGPIKNPNPEPFTWPESIGLLRSSADAGKAAVARALAAQRELLERIPSKDAP